MARTDRGQKGPWDATTRERYERVVRLQVLASADPTRRPLGELKLRDVTPDRVAVWSQGNEQALAPSTPWLALIALNQICRYAIRRGWMGVNPVAQLEPGENPAHPCHGDFYCRGARQGARPEEVVEVAPDIARELIEVMLKTGEPLPSGLPS